MGAALCKPGVVEGEPGVAEDGARQQEVVAGRRGDLLLDYVAKDAYANARELNTKFMAENRVNHSQFVKGPTPEARPLQLLKATVSTVVFSAVVDDFRFWVENPANNVNVITISMSPSNVNYSCTMLTCMDKLTQELQDPDFATKCGGPEAIVTKYIQYQDIWLWLKETSASLCFTHPQLGVVPVTGTLLHACVMQRGAGSGNGEGSSPDPVLEYLLSHGADPNTPDCFGITALQLTIAALFSRLDNGDSDYVAQGLQQAVTLVGLLLQYGADPHQKLKPFRVPGLRVFCNSTYQLFEEVLTGSQELDAFELLDHWAPAGDAKPPWQADIIQQLRDTLEGTTPGPAPQPVSAEREAVPWGMAVYNIVWSLAQLLREPAARDRRVIMQHMAATAPFDLPAMRVVPFLQLRDLGHIPRFCSTEPSTLGVSEGISAMPYNGVAVFVSHRWLGGNAPDDADGNKFKQIMAAVEQLAELEGVALPSLYCWLDYACVDQANPAPGVQALPMFLACCDHFVYLSHPQYMERAWCLTEQFIYHKLSQGAPRYFLEPDNKVVVQPFDKPPADPALGKIYDEKDRIALASMTAILQNREAD